jgi:methyl-galactoside transport system substrate-binding protein
MRRQPSEEVMNAWDKTCFIDFNYPQGGTAQGEIVANLPDNGDINGDGVVSYVMIAGDPGNENTQYRTEYSVKALTDRGIVVEELVRQNGDWTIQQGYDIASAALSQFGDRIDVIFCNNDFMAIGASQVISEAGRTVNKDIYLVGWDATAEGVDMIDNGQMTGTVRIDSDSLAEAAVEAAINYLQGKKNEKYTWIDYIPIASEVD